MKILAALLLIISFLKGMSQENLLPDYNCFSVLVGKNASVEGTLLYGHNDDDGFQLVNYYIEPRKNYPRGAGQTLQYGGRIPQVPATNKFLWLEVPGMEVSDGFMNDYGVCIGSNYCGSRETESDTCRGGILYDLRLIMAQRAKSAREAIHIAGSLIEEFGYRGSGRSYCISDREEAWVLSVVKGRRWAAYRFLEENYDRNDIFPFSFKPKKKVSKQKLMELLAGHSQGMQEMDKTESCTIGNPYELNEGMICNGGTIYSFVVESRPWMPVEIGTVMWLAPRRCDVQPFIPWYCGITRIPENYSKKGYLNSLKDHYNPPSDIHQMSKDQAYWNFEILSANINKNFIQKYPIAVTKKKKMETSLLKAQTKFEKGVLKKYEMDPVKAIEMITKYSNQQAYKSYKQTVALLRMLKIPFPNAATKAVKIKDDVPAEN